MARKFGTPTSLCRECGRLLEIEEPRYKLFLIAHGGRSQMGKVAAIYCARHGRTLLKATDHGSVSTSSRGEQTT